MISNRYKRINVHCTYITVYRARTLMSIVPKYTGLFLVDILMVNKGGYKYILILYENLTQIVS